MSNETKALKSGIWYTASNFLVRGIGFITTPIFARLLTTEEYGDYNNFTSWMSILTIVVTLNLEATLITAKFDYKDRFDSYILSTMSLSMLSCFIWTVILNAFSDIASSVLSMPMVYINCLMAYLFFHPAVTFFQARERYMYRYKSNVITSLLIAISVSILSVILVLTFTDRLTGRIIGHITPTILIGLVFTLYFILKGKKVDTTTWKYAIKICLPYIPHLLSLTLLNSMDRVMIKRICGASDTALYSLAYTCGSLVTLLITSMNGAYSPWLGDQLHKKDYSAVRKFSTFYIITFCYAAMGVMLIAPEILWILGGEKYAEAKYVMTPVTMGCICQFLYTMFVNVEQFNKKTIGMAIGSVTAALFNYILNSIFIPKYGYIAAAYTTLIGFLWLLCVHMFIVYKLNFKEIYNYKLIAIIVGILIGLTIGVNFLYSYSLVRYFVIIGYIAVGAVLIVKNKEKLIAIAHRLR